MLRHAVINPQGKVVNVIIWDGVNSWQPPKDHIAVQNDYVDMGDLYDFETKTIRKFDGNQFK